ncbi:Peptide chain release factor 1, mitochondrial [Scedosporium apiospermum]|uniref:Peptide chain release factor 1, mitochondrial n=1 Tax=Pseudallescheria apiosperma TaxID=563466 RepID=A0A084FZZ8_PSEDA|nr:Peptide chain release factor 1, mitochondrial [Scedosporium apiospermum]KEZ40660.1 Peptide chain release factor 1, mitochondrial [Scedosporium apiospermum]
MKRLATHSIWRRPLTPILRYRAPQFFRSASSDTTTSLPPALLQRARNLASEHDRLSKSLSDSFDTKTARRVGELSNVATALQEFDEAQDSLAELHSLLTSQDAELRQLAADELEPTTERVEALVHKLTAALTPKHPFADMPCLLEFRPGPGGLEGRFFTDTLFRMYKQYLSRHGFRVRIVKYEIADSAGDSTGAAGENPVQEAVLEVEDVGSYDLLRGEAGMHRVQRIPVTESKGRTHTSAVALWVLPSFPESNAETADYDDPESIFYINPSDVKQEVMRARGAGGQHVNKTESAVRLTHIPTGTSVSMQDSRSQVRNRVAAWQLLRARVAQQRREEREEMAFSLRNSVLAKDKITRADKIRTYNYSQDRCTDHRSGLDVHNLPDVLEGGETLDRVIQSVREWMVARDIRAMMADEEAKATAENGNDKKA